MVDRVVQLGRRDDWQLWWETFDEAGEYLERRAERLRQSVNWPDLSTRRVFDVLLWSWGKIDGLLIFDLSALAARSDQDDLSGGLWAVDTVDAQVD